MAIDASIIGRLQPMQIPQQDPNAGMNALARMMQVSGAMDEQRVNALKYQDLQRTVERRNKLDSLLGGFNGKPEELGPTLLRGGFLDEAGKIEKDRREAEKSGAEAAFKRIETAHKTVELTGQTMGWLRQNPTLENATAAISHLVTVGGMPPEQGQQILTSLQANPNGVANFADMVFRSALATKEQLPKLQTNNIGGSTVTQQFDPVTGRQLGVASSIPNTQSPDSVASVAATRRGQDLVNQRALDTAAQGKWQYDAERGGLVNMQTGEFKPATQGGKPLGAKPEKTPPDFTKGMTGINELNLALDSYEKALKEAGGASSLATGPARAKLQGAYTALKMGLKNAFELGALTGPDVGVLEGMLVDPTSPKVMVLGDGGINEQITQTRSYLKNRESALESTYGKKNPAKENAKPTKAVKRTGTAPDGRKVVEYTDGTIDYAP